MLRLLLLLLLPLLLPLLPPLKEIQPVSNCLSPVPTRLNPDGIKPCLSGVRKHIFFIINKSLHPHLSVPGVSRLVHRAEVD